MPDERGIRKRNGVMNKNWLGAVGAVLAIVIILWLIGGGKISCRDSFWDSDKKVIEITHD
ncbi:MAG: hypothetical protein AMXMBFR20_32810 [Planctomycetia bacterium]